MHPLLKAPHLQLYEKRIVEVLSRHGPMSQGDIVRHIPGLSQSKASRTLSHLIEAGLVQKTGSTKAASFGLPALIANFTKPPHLRPTVHYDNRIEAYEPNATRWLPIEAEGRMYDAARLSGPKIDASTYSKKIAERFAIDLSWASSALEGNTYEYLETESLIKYREKASGRDEFETTMILNHKAAISFLIDGVSDSVIGPQRLQRLHALLMRGLLDNRDIGKIRASGVRIGGSSYRPSEDSRALTHDFSQLCWKASEIESPYEASFFLLAGLSYLQAFEDGNKRTGRLACNIPLLANGLPPMSFTTMGGSDYTVGLIVFYESNDPSILAEVIAEAYAQTAPIYSSSLATQRVPHRIEIHLRQEIDETIQQIVRETITGTYIDTEELIGRRFSDLATNDLEIIREAIRDALKNLTPENSVAWGVSSEDADSYRLAGLGGATPEP